ncbi:MAG: Cys-tRNA(Pro) deacylase [Clostridia bacterium]|nr:Cys-tRNA(Pro) deacylase [Clostridia bacterium]
MGKEVKTNAMRMLDQKKIPYRVNLYECDEFVDGVSVADLLGQPYENSFKTLVTVGKSGGHYVFVVPIAEELDFKKCARAVGEKSVEMIHLKDLTPLTGYIRGGCTAIGMKKQFPTVIHQSAKDFAEIIVSGGRIGAQIILSPDDLARAVNAKFADIVKETAE